MENRILREFILKSLAEDIGDGDHSSLACIPPEPMERQNFLLKRKEFLQVSV